MWECGNRHYRLWCLSFVPQYLVWHGFLAPVVVWLQHPYMTLLTLAVGTFLENKSILQMKDFQFGWYMRLLFHLAKSGGYLPLDCTIGTLAGAHSGQYWEANAGPVLACFKVQEREGRKYIYSDNVLAQVSSHSHEASHTHEGEDGQRVSPSQTLPFPKESVLKESELMPKEVPTLFEEAYELYPRHVGLRAAENAFMNAVKRLAKQKKIQPIEAAKFLAHMAGVYAESPAGKRGKFTPHMSTWLNQDRFLDDPLEWNRTEEKQSAQRERLDRNLAVIEETFAGVDEGDDGGDAAAMATAGTQSI